MRLVSCCIGGFGKIKEYEHDFSQGLNVLLQDNGWGKTTFSVFLKAMFYGMEYTRKQGLSEREHYRPWDGGVYGGNLVFETEGHLYRVERTFGKNDKEDTFALFDELTGKPSEDYGPDIGEALFEVDRQSFEKSIYIPQNGLDTGMTDSLNAKMGNLSAVKDDINNFDKAAKAIDEARKNYTRRSNTNTGKLELMKRRLRECNDLLEQQAAMTEGYRKQTGLLEERKAALTKLEHQKSDIAEKISSQSKREQSLGAYREKKQELEKYAVNMEALENFFGDQTLEPEEISSMEELERQIALKRHSLLEKQSQIPSQEEIHQMESLFASGVPEKEELRKWNDWAVRLQELRMEGESARLSKEKKSQLEELGEFFAKKLPDEEEMAAAEQWVMDLTKLEGRVAEAETRYHMVAAQLKEKEKAARKNSGISALVVMLILTAALVGGGIAFRMLTPDSEASLPLQIACFTGALVLGLVGVLSFIRHRGSSNAELQSLKNRLADARETLEGYREMQQESLEESREFLANFRLTPMDTMQQMVTEIRRNLDAYHSLKADERASGEAVSGALEELADLQLQLYTALQPYAEVYQIDLYHNAQEQQLLQRLQKDIRKYVTYQQNQAQSLELKEECSRMEEELNSFIRRFPVDAAMDPTDQLKEIRSKWTDFERIAREMEALYRDIYQFERTNQIDENSESVEVLQEKQRELDVSIAEMNQNIAQDKENLLAIAEELEKFEEAAVEKEQLTEDIAAAEKKVWLLENTYRCLQMAKDSFLSKYLQPLQKGMNKYLTMLDPNPPQELEKAEVRLDVDLSVQLSYQGTSKSGGYLSTGYQDLTALCARLALLDVLYQKEQPVLILDDPFTNLDQEKIALAMKMLQNISKERQVIYFTCHESRAEQ